MDDQGFESINVIPFIDIMLVLLTIVLTTSTFIASGAIDVQLPSADSGQPPVEQQLTIEIDPQGVIYYHGRATDISGLAQQLAESRRSVPVIIRADRKLQLQQFVTVMDLVKQLGFKQVSLLTEKTP